jgi:glycerol-3-phosphate dehydrogenase (NAD(P)+)
VALAEAAAGIHPEGVRTTLAACALAEKKGIEMPIARQMKAVLYEGKPPREALDELMLRSLKRE